MMVNVLGGGRELIMAWVWTYVRGCCWLTNKKKVIKDGFYGGP